MLTFFLEHAREWWAVADALRARGVTDDPALTVWREAAWCHLLFARGMHAAAVARLRGVLRDAGGSSPRHPSRSPTSEAEALATAAELFVRLRAAVSARHPAAFGRSAA